VEVRSDLPGILVQALVVSVPLLLLVSLLALRAGDRPVARVFATMALILSVLPATMGLPGALEAAYDVATGAGDLLRRLVQPERSTLLFGEGLACSLLAWRLLQRIEAGGGFVARPFLAGRRVSSRSAGGGSAPRG
jgi:hypothetical protein